MPTKLEFFEYFGDFFQKEIRVPKLRKEDFQRRLGVLKIDDNHKLQSVTQRVEQCLSVAEPFHPKV